MRTLMKLGTLTFTTLLVVALTACASQKERADEALARSDWDGAVEHYSKALSTATDPEIIDEVQARLSEAKTAGAAEHFAAALNSSRLGDVEHAYQEASIAFDYNPTPESTMLLAELRGKELSRLLEAGSAALTAEDWVVAVRDLQLASDIEGRRDVLDLLAVARRGSQDEFERSVALGRESLRAHKWADAVEQFSVAHRFGGTERSQDEYQFVELMADVEGRVGSGIKTNFEFRMVVQKYEKALATGIESEHVLYRLERIQPADYVLTVHGATILPFKPQSRRPWDGLGAAVADANVLIAGFGKMLGPQGAAAELAPALLGLVSKGTDAPDCYPVLSVSGVQFGGVALVDQDDLMPTWDLMLPFPRVTRADTRTLMTLPRFGRHRT